MKKFILLFLMVFPITKLWSQNPFMFEEQKPVENRNFRIPLIGETAPAFTAESTKGKIKFPEDFGRSWKIVFSHPQDFTPVCTTEILELANLQSQFDKLGVKIVALSTDQLITHEQWIKAMEGLSIPGQNACKNRFSSCC